MAVLRLRFHCRRAFACHPAHDEAISERRTANIVIVEKTSRTLPGGKEPGNDRAIGLERLPLVVYPDSSEAQRDRRKQGVKGIKLEAGDLEAKAALGGLTVSALLSFTLLLNSVTVFARFSSGDLDLPGQVFEVVGLHDLEPLPVEIIPGTLGAGQLLDLFIKDESHFLPRLFQCGLATATYPFDSSK